MIRAHNLSKYFGSKRALGPVSFEIDDGEAVGFLGLNGAGKTTALRIFACDLRPSQGSVIVGDIDAVQSPHEVRKRIGFLPETPPLYMEMIVSDYIVHAGLLRKMSASAVKKRLPEVLEATDLTEVKDEVVGHLSHGYKQRVGLAQAIVHEPSLLILDEPTRGLDPVQIVEMRKLIRNLKEKHTVLISSHILTEISETCDRLLVLGKGEIIGEGSEADLASTFAAVANVHIKITIVTKADDASSEIDSSQLHKELEDIDGVQSVKSVNDSQIDAGAHTLEISAKTDIRAALCRSVIENGHDVIGLERSERALESIFINMVQGGNDANH